MVDSRKGALTMALAAFLFSIMAAGVKAVSADLPTEMVVFFRNVIGVGVLLPWLMLSGFQALATQRFGLHLLRGLAGLAAMYLSFYSIARMRVADALLLNYTMPLFIPIIARVWLKEKMPDRLWVILGFGYLGVALVLKPGWGLFQGVSLLALLAGVTGALAQVDVRQMTQTEPVLRIVFYFALISTVVSGFMLIGHWKSPTLPQWGLLLLLGLSASVAQLFLTRAYELASPSEVGPFIYVAVVFAGVFDWIFWDKVPDVWSLAGAGVIVLTGAWAIRQMSLVEAEA